MIAQLKGKILKKDVDSIIVDVSGVGYRVFILPSLSADEGEKISLYTHLYIREDAMVLYGFAKEDELYLFELLISVSGIGPKAGLGILSVGSVETIKKAIAEERSDILKSVSGVGSKIANRAILELKDRISTQDDIILPKQMTKEDESAVGALVNLGYKKQEAALAISEVSKDKEVPVDEKIKQALKYLGK